MSYILKYRDLPVLEFNISNKKIKIIHKTLLPFCISTMQPSWDMVVKFCSDRVLINNRLHVDVLLKCLRIDNFDPVQICIKCNGLSLKDNYWICDEQDTRSWNDVNLYDNDFDENISKISLTSIKYYPDTIITPELTLRGVRTKCFYKDDNGIYLAKSTTEEEKNSELLSGYIANAIDLPHATYTTRTIYDTKCQVCKIATNDNTEMIHARDVISHFNCDMANNTDYYDYFMSQDTTNFIKMQLFDYLTLNTDRNRDNYALQKQANQITGLYPIFDHDSLFKAKSTKAIYFVTRTSFDETLRFLKENYNFDGLRKDFELGYEIMTGTDFKELFLEYKTIQDYNGIITRFSQILKVSND